MQVLLVAGIGVAAVLFGILVARLHPFLALLLGSLIVLFLTPESSWFRNELNSELVVVQEIADDGTVKLARKIDSGKYLAWKANEAIPRETTLSLNTKKAEDDDTYWATIADSENKVKPNLQVGDRIIAEETFLKTRSQWQRARLGTITKRLSAGLSGTFHKIGLAIAMAAFVGVCLLESGAANSLVQGLSRCFGEKRTAPTLMVSGFVLGVPIFFDTVFYLLLPLAKAFGRQRPEKALLSIMSIIVGATMAHSLVPPTPGPLLVASRLGISIGSMMIGGIVVGGTAAFFGFLYSLWCNQTMNFRLEAVDNRSSDQMTNEGRESSQNRSMPVWLASLPLAIPILCLGGIEISKVLGWTLTAGDSEDVNASSSAWNGAIDLLSDPGFVLMIAAAISYVLLRRVITAKQTMPLMTTAIADAGTILLLTCAGGAFGAALEQLRIADAVTQMSSNLISPHVLLFAAFFLTGLIRVAQGSATIAMITSVGIVAPFVQGQELPFHPVYVALSIGCGSKLMPWMNDSGFWQVSTMTGLNTTQTLRTFSVALTLMGCVGFTMTLLGSWLLPLKLVLQ